MTGKSVLDKKANNWRCKSLVGPTEAAVLGTRAL